MRTDDLTEAFRILRRFRKSVGPASVTEIGENHPRDPFRVLVSCLISLRTKDSVTTEASERLFRLADTPERMVTLSEKKIAEAIYPCGFYRTKAASLKSICRDLIENHSGKTPDTIEELLALQGVGRKTANLVVTLGHGKPGICVDIHVHRIANRWGLVETKAPDATEWALREILPKRYWIPINDLLVRYGQQVCRPVSPYCSRCELKPFCDRKEVERSR